MPNNTPHLPNSFRNAKRALLARQAREAAVRLHRSRTAAIALEHPGVSRFVARASEADQKAILDALEVFADKSALDKPFKAVTAFSLRNVKVTTTKQLLWRALEDGDRMACAGVGVQELVSA